MSGPGPYNYLFSPLRVGPLTLRNRVVFAAHLTNYAENGLPSAQHAAYYAARAAGGAGLIITEEHSTHRTDWALWHALDGAPFELHRVGDCRAPRRAHAAVIEGERAGAAL